MPSGKKIANAQIANRQNMEIANARMSLNANAGNLGKQTKQPQRNAKAMARPSTFFILLCRT
jgi:hypothetical protein